MPFPSSNTWLTLAVAALGLAPAAGALAEEPASGGPDQILSLKLDPRGLTANEVARRAVRTSADVAARRVEVEAAAAVVIQNAVGFAPRLSFSFSYARLSDITPPLFGYSVVAPGVTSGPVPSGAALVSVPQRFPALLNATTAQALLSVPVSDYLLRLSQTYTASRRSKRAAELQAQAQQLKVQADARIAFYNWIRAALGEIVAEQTLTQVQGHLRDVRSSFTQGIASRADVLRVESQVAVAEGLRERSRNYRAVAEEQLRTQMHEPVAVPLTAAEDVSQALPALKLAMSPVLYAEALRARPELRALEDTELSLAEQARAARAGLWPRLDAFGEVTVQNPNQRYIPPPDEFDLTWSVGLRLSFAPNDIASAHAQGRVADARTQQVAAQRAALVDGVRSEVALAVQAVRDADTAVSTSARGLAASEASYRVRLSLFRVGRATSVELTDAESDLLRSRLDAVNARVDQRIARVRLDRATGRDALAQGESQ